MKSNNNYNQNNEYSTLITKSWLTCHAFGFEKWLWRKLGSLKKNDAEIVASTYDIDDTIGIWKVVAKTNNEILLKFNVPHTNWVGATYISVYPTNNSNSNKIENPDNEENEWTVCFGTARINPPRLLIPTLNNFIVPVHSLYSRMLLASTARKFEFDCNDIAIASIANEKTTM